MTRLRNARGLAAALVLGGAMVMLAGCHTVGGTVSGLGQDIGNTGKFLAGGPQGQPAPPASAQAATPAVTQPRQPPQPGQAGYAGQPSY